MAFYMRPADNLAARIPDQIKNACGWLLWRELANGDKKPIKFPLNNQGNGQNWTSPELQFTFDEAVAGMSEHVAGIGLVVPTGSDIVFIDVDNCLVDGSLDARGRALLDLGSYVEISPSQKGLRGFCLMPEGIQIGDLNRNGIEVYVTGGNRWLTVTGKGIGATDLSRPSKYDMQALLDLAPKPERKPAPVRAVSKPNGADFFAELDRALGAIDPDIEHDQWIRVGMALKTELADAGLELFELWSSAGQKYQAGECEKRWASFDRAEITAATVFELAMQNTSYDRHLADLRPASKVFEGLLSGSIACGNSKKAELEQFDVKPWPENLPSAEENLYQNDIHFPIDSIPEPIRDMLIAENLSKGLPYEYTFPSIMTLCGAVIGRRYSVTTLNNLTAIPNTWGMLVARSGSGKSIGSDIAFDMGIQLEGLTSKADADRFNAKEYDLESEIEQLKVMAKDAKAGAEDKRSAGIRLKEAKAELKTLPRRTALVERDTNGPSLMHALSSVRGGLMLHFDEIAKLKSILAGGNGTGEDFRSALLTCWKGSSSVVGSRMGRDYQTIHKACLTTYFNATTSIMAELLAMEAGDGLVPRFGLAFAPVAFDFPEHAQHVPSPYNFAATNLQAALASIHTPEFEGTRRLTISTEAHDIFIQYMRHTKAIVANKDGALSETHSAAVEKYNEQLIKLAGVFHVIGSEPDDIRSEVSAETMTAAVAVMVCVEAHSHRIYGLEGNTQSDDLARLRRLRALPVRFTAGKFRAMLKVGDMARSLAERTAYLELLIEQGYIRDLGPKSGRLLEKSPMFYNDAQRQECDH
tara:strand:- start:4162 stop:6591 length:2430 start_codon:yes stop_codon:yes gene_type:complete